MLLARALLPMGNQHRRAWESLCVIVSQARAGSALTRDACSRLRSSSGCPSGGATCCAACGPAQ
ncbi:MAG: hypothetical protein U0324_13355 [Polyangiales bacterium]